MKLPALATVLAAFAIGVPASAQDKADDHAAHHPAKAEANAPMAEGEVRRINKDVNKITLRHGELKSLGMPPMTMVFNVRDPALLDAVKVGDKVLFTAAKDADGSFVVTAIKPAH